MKYKKIFPIGKPRCKASGRRLFVFVALAVIPGGEAGDQLEGLVEIGDGVEAYLQRDVQNGKLGIFQQLDGFLHPDGVDVFHGGLAGDGLEQKAEMGLGVADIFRNLLKSLNSNLR